MVGLTTDICLFWPARSALDLGYDVLVLAEASDDALDSIGDTDCGAAEDGEGRTFLAREK